MMMKSSEAVDAYVALLEMQNTGNSPLDSRPIHPDHLRFRQGALIEEFFHEAFVVLGCGFNKGIIHFCGFIHLFGRYIKLFTFTRLAFVAVHLHGDQIDEGIEVAPCVNRI